MIITGPRFSPPSSTAENLSGWATLIGSLALLIVAAAILIVVWRKFSHFDAKVDTKLGSIEFAVNGIALGEAPLIDKVRWLEDCMTVIGEHLGLSLPEPRRRPADARTRSTDHQE